MNLIINIILIIILIILIIKLKYIYIGFEFLINKFMNVVTILNNNNIKSMEEITKISDKLNKNIYNMATIQKEIDDLHKISMSLNQLNSQYNENININSKTNKDIVINLNKKIFLIENKVNKLNALLIKFNNAFKNIMNKLKKE